MLRVFALALVLFVAASTVPPAALAQTDRLVVLVRHAEAGGEPADDPPLTAEGQERAQELARVLEEANVGSVIVSGRARTRLTGEPLSDTLGISPLVVDVSGGLEQHVNAVAHAVLSQNDKAAVLVVGHSNTIPAIIGALGGPMLADLCHDQFSRLFVLQIPADGPARLIKASYGAPDVGGEGECP
jgi:broad specificity phosphatase PhoE